MRIEKDFNFGWLFHKGDIDVPRPIDKGPVYSQSKTQRKLLGPACYAYYDNANPFISSGELKNDGWKKTDLPHDYIVDQDLKENENNALGYLHYDNAWYRKHFTLTADEIDGKRILLRFDGIAGKSTVYLNGCLMYHNFSSYNSFEIDISDYVFADKDNVIAVYVNTEEFEGWWYQGGGIYRNVHLTITEPVAVDLWGVYVPYKKISDDTWQIDFETTVVNSSYEDCIVTAQSSVIDKNENIVAVGSGDSAVALRHKGIIKYMATVKNPMLWDIDMPNLYTVKTVLSINGAAVDEVYTKIGFRTIEISAENGLFLNGKKVFINGVCGHQDFGLTGLAVPENVAKYKVKLLKEMGANGYRTSHYQQTAAYMDAFDEMGFLVMDEARWFESTKESLEQLDSLIKRDRNRPSVIMWSTSNEEPLHITENGQKIHRSIAEHIRQLDRTRYITAAEDKTPDKSTIYDYCDIIGINYNLDLYDEVHKMCPEKPIFSSECCATNTTRDWNLASDTNGRVRDYDTDTNSWFKARESTYKFLKSKPYIFGAYQWVSVDHRGEAVWPAISSKCGAFDMFLQKKGAFYQNQSLWTEKPMAHIVQHWNFNGLEGKDLPVTIYTNCEELELFLNGKSQGRKQIEKYGRGEWKVEYNPGTLKVKGYINGKLSAEDTRQTTGKAERLKLTALNDFQANGKDLALFLCECIDKNEVSVPDASEYVHFTVESPAIIVGTGSDNCDHNRVSCTGRKMYMGKILVAVKPQKGQQSIVLTAFSDNCGTAMINIEF